MSKRILNLNYEFPPLGGGQGNANYYLLKQWSKNDKYIIDVVTSSTDKYLEENFADNTKIYYLDVWKNGKKLHAQSVFNLILNFIKTFFVGIKLIKKNKYDVVLCWSYPAIIVGYLFQKIYGVQYIAFLRGADVPFADPKWNLLDKIFFVWFAPVLWKNSKHVIANSQYLKSLALKKYPKQEIEVIPNGVDLEMFYKGKTKDEKSFRAIFVGRLSEIKGLQYLIEGFTKFSKDKSDVFLDIVGKGELYNKTQSHIKVNNMQTKIILYGNLVHDDLANYYKNSNIFLLPSINEGMSNALLEAMACGLPVIITKVGGYKELFDSNGWLVNHCDADGIAQKLELAYLAWQEGKLNSIGQNSLEIIKKFSRENSAKMFDKYF